MIEKIDFFPGLISFHSDNDIDRKTNLAPQHLHSVYSYIKKQGLKWKQNIMSYSESNDSCDDELEKYNNF